MPETPVIRLARLGDIERLQDIERAAGVAFVGVGMPEVADDEPLPTDVLARFASDGRAWVWEGPDGSGDQRTAAYILVEMIDGAAHIAQVSVDPAWARQGIGSQLVDHVSEWAAVRGLLAVTLTTFREVPWNAPYYARIGFRVMSAHEIGPQLRQTIASETALGLNPSVRVAMTRPVR